MIAPGPLHELHATLEEYGIYAEHIEYTERGEHLQALSFTNPSLEGLRFTFDEDGGFRMAEYWEVVR